jgi:hypothetical protein
MNKTIEQRIGLLAPWYSVFMNMGMMQTALSLIDLQIILSRSNNFEEIRKLFSQLENLAHKEFPNKTQGIIGYDLHRDEIFNFISNKVGKSVKENFNDAKYASDYSFDIINRRTQKLKHWGNLINSFKKENITNVQKFLGFGILYLTKFEGFFEEDIKICYMWLKLSEKEIVTKEILESTTVGNVKQYLESKSIDLSIFEGWEPHLRNSIAHLSFIFDEENNKMTYVDRDWKITLSLNELLQMNQKLVNVNEAITILFGLVIIRDVCFATNFDD